MKKKKKLRCERCGNPMEGFGYGLAFQPHGGRRHEMFRMYNICERCWLELKYWMKGNAEVVATRPAPYHLSDGNIP